MAETINQDRAKFLEIWDKEGGLSGAALKLIACFFMFFDHLAQSEIFTILKIDYELLDNFSLLVSKPSPGLILVLFGRLVFPVFCFLIVQGVMLTGDRKKYILRLFGFALISEVFYDYGLFGYLNWHNQNVFFTLGLGALMMTILDYIGHGDQSGGVKLILNLLTLFATALISQWLRSDYSVIGIFAIFILWLCRWSRGKTLLGMVPAFLFISVYGAVYLAIPLIYMYNGRKGNINKYFFYLFYPVHFLLIWIIRMFV